jgi:hypothetical protein
MICFESLLISIDLISLVKFVIVIVLLFNNKGCVDGLLIIVKDCCFLKVI